MPYTNIKTSKIIVDEKFRISFKKEDEGLLNSIQAYGIKKPLILQKDKGKFFLIAGYKRFDTIKALGIKDTEYKIIEDRLTDCEKLTFNIDDNLATRALSLYEKINALNKLKKYGCEQFLKYISLLNISPALLEGMDMSKLPYKILEMLNKGDFDKRTLLLLQYFNRDQLVLISEYFNKIQFTKSEKKKFIDNLLRAEETGFDITEFLKNNLSCEKMRLLKQIYKITNPQTERLEKKLYSLQKELKGVKLFAAPYFEDPFLKLEIRFKDFKQLKKTLERLSKQITGKNGSWYED